jgi:hypothetical protein
MRLFIYFIFCAVFFSFTNQNSDAKHKEAPLAVTDSERYFNEIFQIQDISKIRHDQILELTSISDETYKTLANIILINNLATQKDANSLKSVSEIFESTIKSKTHKILKDYITILYAKILLTQVNLTTFKESIIPIIDDKNFTFRTNGLELQKIYYILNQEKKEIKIESLDDTKNNNIYSAIKRIKIMDIEAQK